MGDTFTVKLGDYSLTARPSCDYALCPTDFPTPSQPTSGFSAFERVTKK